MNPIAARRSRMQVEHTSLQKAYKGYTLYGSAQCEFGSRNQWSAIGSVLLLRPDNTCLQVDRVHYPLLKYDDEDLSKWFGLGLAEIAVDEFLPPVEYYLRTDGRRLGRRHPAPRCR